MIKLPTPLQAITAVSSGPKLKIPYLLGSKNSFAVLLKNIATFLKFRIPFASKKHAGFVFFGSMLETWPETGSGLKGLFFNLFRP